MAPKELIDIIACGETSTVQFKRQVDSVKQLVEETVAFANSKGGTLLLGRSKQRNHLMAELCQRTMIYRGLGSGIPRVLREGAKVDFVSNDRIGDFKTIIWRNPELAVLEGDALKTPNGSSESSPEINGDSSESSPKTDDGSPNVTDGSLDGSPKTEISSPKTKDMIVELMRENPMISTKQISERLGISKRAVIKHTNDLQLTGRIKHVGSLKGGHWEVTEN